MQPIVLLGVAVAAVALVGTGFLNNDSWNEFKLYVQQLGWGEDMLTSPISHAFVDLEIKKLVNENGTFESDCEAGEGQEQCLMDARMNDYYDNVIHECSFHADKDIPAAPKSNEDYDIQILNPGIIICKMLNEDGNAIAEGKVTIEQIGGYESSDKEFIPINQCILPTGHVSVPFDAEEPHAFCLDVQTPIHFVKLVVEDVQFHKTAVVQEP